MNDIKGTRTSCANTKKKREYREIQTWLSHVFLKVPEPQNQTVEMASNFLRSSTNMMEDKSEKKIRKAKAKIRSNCK